MTHQEFSLERFWEWQTYSWLDPLACPTPLNLPCFSYPQQDGKKTSLGDLSFFILHNLISGIQVLVLLSPNKKCLSPGRRPSKQAAAGWEKGACQPRAAERVSHGSYLQTSKELQRLPIKTLLKHFWCCQQQRPEIAQWCWDTICLKQFGGTVNIMRKKVQDKQQPNSYIKFS